MQRRRMSKREEARRLNTPPSLPTRCGTALLRENEDAQMATFVAWAKAEQEYCAWVDAHPSPKPEWVERAESIRRRDHEVQNMDMSLLKEIPVAGTKFGLFAMNGRLYPPPSHRLRIVRRADEAD